VHPLSPGPERLQPTQRALLLLRLRPDTSGEVRIQHVPFPARGRGGGCFLMAGLRGWARAGSALLALAFAACELPEVAAPDSADVLVVEAVLRAGAGQQYILLHRSIQGEVVDGEP